VLSLISPPDARFLPSTRRSWHNRQVTIPRPRAASEAPDRNSTPRPGWWREALLVFGGYWLYSAVRNVAPSHSAVAIRRAADLLAGERRLHLDVELPVNTFVAGIHWLAYVCDYYYATMHFAVTLGVLLWLYIGHAADYRRLRSAWLATNLVALVGFYTYALAPPRMLGGTGFVDTVVRFHTWGSWGSAEVTEISNQYAAMPSLHIAWALWCAVAVITVARRRWLRVVAFCYPVVTLFVVVGTANHFVLDAVGGMLALLAGFAVERLSHVPRRLAHQARRRALRSGEEHGLVDQPGPPRRTPVVLD
jgi:hypothetical protein